MATIPSLPARASTDWYAYAQGLDTAARGAAFVADVGVAGTATGDALGAHYAPTARSNALANLSDSIGMLGCYPDMAVSQLAASAAAGATTISVATPVTPGSATNDFGGLDVLLKVGTEYVRTHQSTAISGSGPYTVTLAATGLASAHAAGEPVISVPTYFGSPSPVFVASIAAQGKVAFGGLFGHASATVEQLTSTYLPLVLAAKPGYCYVMAGRNDLTDGQTATTNTALTKTVALWDALLAAGILPIGSSLPPIAAASSAAQVQQNQRFNSMLAREAAKRGIPFTDLYALMVDPSTGTWASQYLLDGTHPNIPGRWVQGQDIWTVLSPTVRNNGPLLPTTQIYADTSIYKLAASPANAIFLSGGGGSFGAGSTSAPPAGWNTVITDAVGTVTRATVSGWAGQGMVTTRAAGSSSGTNTAAVTGVNGPDLAPGNRYRFAMRVKSSGVTAARTADANFGGWGFRLTVDPNGGSSAHLWVEKIYQDIDGILVADFVFPSNTTGPVVPYLYLPGTAATPSYSVTIGQLEMLDLTVLGEAATSSWPL